MAILYPKYKLVLPSVGNKVLWNWRKKPEKIRQSNSRRKLQIGLCWLFTGCMIIAVVVASLALLFYGALV